MRAFWKAYRMQMGLMMGDAETLFRLAALNTAYANCIDADRLEDWPGLFVERLPLQDHHGRQSRAAAMRPASSMRIRARC